jgi:predicted acyltransferase
MNTSQPQPAQATSAPRLLSLDAFRGFDIALMFFVNLSAARAAFPEWFGHAGWNGGQHGQWLADYVFPWFLFIVGCSIPFSMHSGRGRSQTTAQRLAAACRRGLVIYALGIVIWIAKTAKDGVGWSSGAFTPDPGTAITWGTFLHWDILPLIGLGYTLAVFLYHLPRAVQVAFVVGVLGAKWALLADLSQTTGLDRAAWMAARTDPEHAVRGLGFLGTALTQGLPATATVMLGVFAGDLLRSNSGTPMRRFWTLLGAGVALTLASGVIAHPLGHRFSKDFFTASFVLVSAGTGAALLAVFYLVLDVLRPSRAALALGGGLLLCAMAGGTLVLANLGGGKWFTPEQAGATAVCLGVMGAALAVTGALWKALGDRKPASAAFFVIYGSNAIFVYMLAELVWTMFWMHMRVQAPGDYGAQHAFGALQLWWRAGLTQVVGERLAAGLGPWLASGTYIMLYWLVCWQLHRRKVFIKV